MNNSQLKLLGGVVAFAFAINAHPMITSYNEAKREIEKHDKDKKEYFKATENKFAIDKKIPRESKNSKEYIECIADMIAIKMASARKTVAFYEKRSCSEDEYKRQLRIDRELFEMAIDIIIKKYGASN